MDSNIVCGNSFNTAILMVEHLEKERFFTSCSGIHFIIICTNNFFFVLNENRNKQIRYMHSLLGGKITIN